MNKVVSLLLTLSIGVVLGVPGELPFVPAETSETETEQTVVVTTETTVPVSIPTETIMTAEVTSVTSAVVTSEAYTGAPTTMPTSTTRPSGQVQPVTPAYTISSDGTTDVRETVIVTSIATDPQGNEVVVTNVSVVGEVTSTSNATVSGSEETSLISVETVAETIPEDSMSSTSEDVVAETTVATSSNAEYVEDESVGPAIAILVIIVAIVAGLLGFIAWKKKK